MTVRAKVRCVEKADTCSNYGPATPATATRVKLAPVQGDENASWSKSTPSGDLTLSITNPGAIAAFVVGADYYVDFTPVDTASTPPPPPTAAT